jgi:hypothetical protein
MTHIIVHCSIVYWSWLFLNFSISVFYHTVSTRFLHGLKVVDFVLKREIESILVCMYAIIHYTPITMDRNTTVKIYSTF